LKIFGIGLNKTGTKTLKVCFERFGYRHKSFDYNLLKSVRQKGSYVLTEYAYEFDSFEDWPWPLYIKDLDLAFPGSKFILTRRKSPEAWLYSLMNHSLATNPEKGIISRTLSYGYPYPHCNPEYFLDFYKSHIAFARDYFKDRRNDFLEVCWESGDEWSILCQFLGINPPNCKFPHANKRNQDLITPDIEINKKILSLFGYSIS
jgi:hypothetical protein